MFDVGFTEVILIGVIALVVLGPERLPVVARKIGRFVGGLQRMFIGFQHEIQRHTQAVEESAKEVKQAVDYGVKYVEKNATQLKHDAEQAATGLVTQVKQISEEE